MERITEFSVTLAPLHYHDAHGSIYDAECKVKEMVDSLNLHPCVHNALMQDIDRYRSISEQGASKL